MNQEYVSVLEEVLRYEQNSLSVVSVMFSVGMIILLSVILFRFRKEKPLNRIIMLSVGVLLCVAFCLYFFFNQQYRLAIKEDIERCSFVTYSGSFVHDEYQRDSFYHNLVISREGEASQTLRYPDYGNQYQLHQSDRIIPAGTGIGTLVYGENSKVVVHCVLEEE